MSLFSASCQTKNIVHPDKVNIEGEVIGSFYSGKIEMSFHHDTEKLEEYTFRIGQSSASKLCLHDFKILVDNNPLSLQIMEKKIARSNFQQSEDEYQYTVYGSGNDSYTSLKIPYVLPNQTITVSADFEMPISFPTKSLIEFSFPLTYPRSASNDEILQCDNFQFICKFNSLPLKLNSVTSNPEGKLNLKTSTYTINSLDSNNSEICIQYDLNPPVCSGDLDDIRTPIQSFLFKDGIASSSGNYGTVTFIPSKDEVEIFGEEFIFIVDCSGSMRGQEIELAGKCLIFFIKSLPENCYFNVVRFGSKFVPLFPKPVPNTDENSQKAIELGFSLEANLRSTKLAEPLKYVFSTPISRKNKMRRIFVLTDGCVFDSNQVITLIKQNTATTMCNAIGIGYAVDKNLVKNIGKTGNGFYDFVLSGDDMRSKVINQLSKSLNGLINVDICIENNNVLEIVPPLSETSLSPNEPATFYFKSSKKFTDKTHVRIDINGRSKPIIIHMNSFSTSSRATKSLMYLFNNENLKYLRNLDQTDNVIQQITKLSIEYGILCPYTALFGVQMYSSEKEKERITKMIQNFKRKEQEEIEKKLRRCKGYGSMIIYVKDICNSKFSLSIDPNATVNDLKKMIELMTGVPESEMRLISLAKTLLDGDASIKSYNIKEKSVIHLLLRMLGGGGGFKIPARTFCKVNADDLVSIVAEQKVEGCWINIPSFIANSKDKKINDAIQKVQNWSKNKHFQRDMKKIVATLISLFYMVSYKKDLRTIWGLVYEKALKWLNSYNSQIKWESIIKSL